MDFYHWTLDKKRKKFAIDNREPSLKRRGNRNFHLFGVDVTPMPRPYAKTLEDKTIIYQPNTIEGNKPLNIGHSDSVLTALPPREETGHLPWAIPDLGGAGQEFGNR